MRFKAILAEEARKRYPLSILLMVVGVLAVPFTWVFMRFGLELTGTKWTLLSIGLGVLVGCAMIGLGSLVEDIHDISMHTVGFDLETGEIEIVPEGDAEDDIAEDDGTEEAGQPEAAEEAAEEAAAEVAEETPEE